MKLTDAAIRRNARVEKPIKLSDGHGLYLQINPTGSKLWKLKYRINGVERKLSMGAYPEIGLAQAREMTVEARKLIGQGIDPSQAKQAARAEKQEANDRTFGKVAGDWYKRWSIDKAVQTIRREKRHMGYLVGALGAMPVSDIKARDVAKCVEDIERVHSGYVAGRCLRLMTEILAYALARGETESNVAIGMHKILAPVRKTHRAAVTDEMGLGAVLRTVWGYPGAGIIDPALKVLAYVFCRPGELMAMRWVDVDLERAEWRYTTSKNGVDMVVPLCRQVLEIIKGMKSLTGDGALVFSARASSLGNAMIALGLQGEQTCHGWRATARTILDEHLGFRPDWIEAQLGHIVKDVNGRAYNRTSHLEGRRQMMQSWADYLDGLRVGEEKRGDNVVSLRKTG